MNRNKRRKKTNSRRAVTICGTALALTLAATNMNYYSIEVDASTVSVNGQVATVIPSSLNMAAPAALSALALPASPFGTLTWANPGVVPNTYSGSYPVVLKVTNTQGADFSQVPGWNPTNSTVTANVTVFVQSLAPTPVPATPAPTVAPATPAPTEAPATPAPTEVPATPAPTEVPATPAPTEVPATPAPTEVPATPVPTEMPATPVPTEMPATPVPTEAPASTEEPATPVITEAPVTTEIPVITETPEIVDDVEEMPQQEGEQLPEEVDLSALTPVNTQNSQGTENEQNIEAGTVTQDVKTSGSTGDSLSAETYQIAGSNSLVGGEISDNAYGESNSSTGNNNTNTNDVTVTAVPSTTTTPQATTATGSTNRSSSNGNSSSATTKRYGVLTGDETEVSGYILAGGLAFLISLLTGITMLGKSRRGSVIVESREKDKTEE